MIPAGRGKAPRLALQAARLTLLAAALAGVGRRQAARLREDAVGRRHAPPIAAVRSLFPEAASVGRAQDRRGAWPVLASDGAALGYVVQTSPASDDVVGFCGPTNVLIGFGPDDRICGVSILSSGDTREHVERVAGDPRFLDSWTGLTWTEAAAPADVDAVSGATLTSLAIEEAIIRRLGNRRVSLRFPNPLRVEDARVVFPRAAKVDREGEGSSVWRVWDERGRLLGTLLRSSPAADQIVGYQGPNDVLIGLDREGRATRVAVRASYDNEPYVSYVRDDEYFLTLFRGMRLAELARLDLEEAGVEGVSGATMTSVAVAEAVVRAAAEQERRLRRSSQMGRFGVQLRGRDAGTTLVVALAVVISLTRLRWRKWARLGLRLTVIGYLGWINGDLVSLALGAGWAAHGAPWRTASGLTILAASALVFPALTGRNLYCGYLCPHGAAQRLAGSWAPRRWRRTPRWLRRLAFLPGALLAVAVVVAVRGGPVELADLEPFDAWVVGLAAGGSFVIAAAGLAATLLTPMAYCRFGCPTGAVLAYARRPAAGDRWRARDWAALGLTALAFLLT